ncbi:MAG: cation diffusion facilitator family transporter [Mariprofundaceae bacterium]
MTHSGHNHALNAAFWLTTVFMLVELVGGFLADSLALMADAGHMASDVAALGLAMGARRIAGRPAHATMTYGYGRAKVIAAQVNGLTLWFLSGWIAWEAAGRLANPPVVQGGVVLIIAAMGLIINLVIMRWLHGGHDMNVRAAYWHVLGDTLGSVAAIVSGLVILWTGWMLIDPILSFVVAGILVWGGWRLVREATRELMEGVPENVDIRIIEGEVLQVSGVRDIHHVHVWCLPDGQLAMSAHIGVDAMENWPTILASLQEALAGQEIEHATLQPEAGCRGGREHGVWRPLQL